MSSLGQPLLSHARLYALALLAHPQTTCDCLRSAFVSVRLAVFTNSSGRRFGVLFKAALTLGMHIFAF